jgi:hypothetical protein
VSRLLALILAVAATASLSSAAASVRLSRPPYLTTLSKQQCPHVLDLPAAGEFDAVRSAMPGLVRNQLGLAINGNGTSYRRWQIIGAISLQPTYAAPVPGAGRWRAMAAARCGSRVAADSWLVTLRFPNMHLINSVGRFYIALTRRGWLMWAYV